MMNRRTEAETLALLREIRDLVQVLVMREIPTVAPLGDLGAPPSRNLFSWASLHDTSRRSRKR